MYENTMAVSVQLYRSVTLLSSKRDKNQTRVPKIKLLKAVKSCNFHDTVRNKYIMIFNYVV